MDFKKDMNRFDRQNRTYGAEATLKLNTSSVVIVGLNGLATETCKNLCLSGIKKIYLIQDGFVDDSDLSTGFYFNKFSLGLNKADVLKEKLSELNPYVEIVSLALDELDMTKLNSVVLLHNGNLEKALNLNKICRESNNKFIWIMNKGVAGFTFVDTLDNFESSDLTGEIKESIQLSSINKDGLVTCAQNNSHEFQTGDYVTLYNLEGINLNFINKLWTVEVVNKTSFKLLDFPKENFTFTNGSAILEKKLTIINHKSLSEQVENKSIEGFNQEFDSKVIDLVLNEEEKEGFWSDEMELFLDTFDYSNDLKKLVRAKKLQLMSVVSILGSIAANEVIKLITNKFLPVSQWIVYSDSSIIPEEKPSDLEDVGLGSLFGASTRINMENKDYLMVGCGAIGCELLKNLAMLNFASNGGKLIVTDPDHIEVSNLSRQFLFRNEDVKKSKSQVASQKILEMNENFKVEALTEKMSSENQLLIDSMEPSLFGIINALDNVAARRYMDEQCFKFGLPLFESGTQGMKLSSQSVIPNLTDTYSNSSDPPQDKSFPVCTLKNFPNEPEHTIHWAMDKFVDFKRGPDNINNFKSKGNEFLDSLSGYDKNVAKKDIFNFCVKYNAKSLADYVFWSCDIFLELFRDQIIQLLHSFPKDSLTSDGELFWSKGKRCPEPAEFDINNEAMLDFIEACTHLLAKNGGIDDNFSREDLKSIVSTYNPYEFSIDTDKKIAKDDTELKDEKMEEKEYQLPDKVDKEFLPIELEKDDDNNWHISFIKATSNLRSINYGIPISSFDDVKGIAGKIVPAVATSTALVAGLVVNEVIKFCQGFSKIEDYKSWFGNLALNILMPSDPIAAPLLKFGSEEFNIWKKFELTENITLSEFIEVYEKKFKVSLSMIVFGSKIIYSNFMPCNLKDQKIFKILSDKSGGNFSGNAELVIAADDDTQLPTIQVKLASEVNSFLV